MNKENKESNDNIKDTNKTLNIPAEDLFTAKYVQYVDYRYFYLPNPNGRTKIYKISKEAAINFGQSILKQLSPIILDVQSTANTYGRHTELFYILSFNTSVSKSSRIWTALKFIDLLASKKHLEVFSNFYLVTIVPTFFSDVFCNKELLLGVCRYYFDEEGNPIRKRAFETGLPPNHTELWSFDFKEIDRLKKDIEFLLSKIDVIGLKFIINLWSKYADIDVESETEILNF